MCAVDQRRLHRSWVISLATFAYVAPASRPTRLNQPHCPHWAGSTPRLVRAVSTRRFRSSKEQLQKEAIRSRIPLRCRAA